MQYVRQLARNPALIGGPSQPTVTGDVEGGRTLYFGKAQCSKCHLMQGKGGFIGRTLTNYARTHGAEAILQAITDPDAPLLPSAQVVVVTTNTRQNTLEFSWRELQIGRSKGWGGLMSTATGLIAYGDDVQNFVVLDAHSGKPLWPFHVGQLIHASPMSYAINGKQYLAIAAGSDIFSFALP